MRSIFSKLGLAKMFRTSQRTMTPSLESPRVAFENLESRTLFSAAAVGVGHILPATVTQQVQHKIVVTNTNDSGPGSLRRAINNANKTSDSVIEFQIHPWFEEDGVFTIKPGRELPALTTSTSVDGSTQVAYTGETNNERPVVFIDGSRNHATNGLTLSGPSESVNDLGITNFKYGDGVLVQGTKAVGDSIYTCLIGADATGTKAAANKNGVSVSGGASGTLIGGIGERNILSGNSGSGVDLEGAVGAIVQGNWIGLDSSGKNALGNGSGIFFDGTSTECIIGGSAAAETANVIAGNTIGIQTTNTPVGETVVPVNYISGNVFGTQAIGSNSVPNTGGNTVKTVLL